MDRVESPHGSCALVALDDSALDAALAELPEAERAAAAVLTGSRRRDYINGRTALHALLPDPIAVLADERGAPVLPAAWSGSISHKGPLAAAIAAPSELGFVGIDLERAAPPRMDISSRVLAPSEPRAEGKQLTRVFAIKEAIYKAVHPIVQRYVGFAEVELAGDVARPLDLAKLPVALEIWCIERDGHWLATARARRR